MSESLARKVQPFTIGTRLSAPAGPKCQEFDQSYLRSQSLDNCALQRNLNSLYLGRSQVRAHGPHGPHLVAPTAWQPAPPPAPAQLDQLNQNLAPASAVSRSIKKITISGSKSRAEGRGSSAVAAQLSAAGAKCENNNNNNNNVSGGTSDPHLPRIVGVSCENKPSSQFKVFLRKDGCDKFQPSPGQSSAALNDERPAQKVSAQPQSQWTERGPGAPTEAPAAAAATHGDCFTQRNSLFSKEALQAEAWIKGKLQDLKDGCNIQRCPLQDWEEASQTLQRDLKDFENTLIQLNQMGEQLICKTNPTSDLVRKQLSQLKDQWQTLKQTAANQKRALGGAKSLQEFNKKVDKLEAWIKEKEEEPHLVNVLEENVDKLQLTRKILDLKQDEQLYRNLHEEINHLALKLEKQEKTDGKNISSRRKQINKMWLKVQAHLKNYHENLQLALEVSSFYQQADNTMFAIDNMRENISASKEMEGLGDREIRDIASQIMMLDVSMSQLSNLHPGLAAGITQKQSEVKDCWLLLQKVFRSDRTTLAPNGSAFARETADPPTPAREAQCIVGTDAQRIMGKEVKEEQNRLKGCASAPECGLGTKLPGSQSQQQLQQQQQQLQQQQQQQSASHTPSPIGGPACGDDVIVRHQQKGESRKPRADPKLHVQLQKFTVSADKTLCWLKDNVSMATQVCSVANFEGLEAARRYQLALEQEILSNRARIEVVKREGRGLVRARHPGSAKIEEFLGQLEALWEELRRRHQRNAVFLQASGELGFRVVKLLQALGSLEAWLESVELSMKESALAGDPETMSTAERESCLLEKEVAARRTELGALRQEVDTLHEHSHPLTQGLQTHMERVEQKYQRVQSALTQQNSELRDTRMLTEFLERVELEESQELHGSRYSLGQPLHSEISAAPTLLGLRSGGSGEPLMESIGDPVEELREAVEMLNDTARERGRAQSHDHAVHELLSKHAGLLVRVEECVCGCKELSLDILERETDMAVQCEPDRCGLGALQERRHRLEVDFEAIGEKVEEFERQAAQLEELWPERMHSAGPKIGALLQGWTELERCVAENRLRLEKFVRLQDFFRSYLAMISWTEDTRSRIFSDAALQLGTDGRRPVAAELDSQIDQRFEEFDELVASGQNILGKEHHLTQMVKERMEELRSMLGWILVHWRAQKQQWLHRKSRRESAQDNIYTEAAMCSPLNKTSVSELEFHQSHQSLQSPAVTPDEDKLKAACDKQPLFLPFRHAGEQEGAPLEDGYEVMKSIAPPPGSPKPSIVLLKEPSGPSAGGTVNLILSLGSAVDGQVQLLDSPAAADEAHCEASEPLHRVSTYLHVKDSCVAAAPVYESITLPRQKCRPSASPTFSPRTSSSSSSSSSSSFSSSTTSSPSSAAPAHPQAAAVTFHHPPAGSGSLFSSLKRMGKKRKRKRDARRHTIQKIMGVEEQREVLYDTHTWPLKDGRRKKGGAGAQTAAYVKNPLQGDIETECSAEYSITPYAVSEGQPVAAPPAAPPRGHCRFLSLGSVLSFDLPKDMTLIPPSIQDIITIAPPESKTSAGADPDPLSQRHTALSSFRQTRALPALSAAPAPTGEDQTGPCEDSPETQPRPHELDDDDLEWDKVSSEVKISAAGRERSGSSPTAQPPIYVNQVPEAAECKHQHKCPSVHTRIRDLNGHLYHKCSPDDQAGLEDSRGPRCPGQTSSSSSSSSHVVVSLKSTVNVSVRQDSVDSGISTGSSARLGADTSAVVGRLVSLEVGGLGCTKNRENAELSSSSTCSPQSEVEPVHPDHQQFEEEEEELEDIWNRTAGHRQSVCSDIMYQPGQNQDQLQPSELSVSEFPPRSTSPQTPAVLYRNLATASAPNLLVAEFKLPPSVQSWLGYNKEQGPKGQLPPLATGDRRSWAAFSNREAASKAPLGVNETASEPVRLPDICDNQKYIYQYREDEEEEEEEGEEEGESERAKVGEEGDEHGSYSKDESRSLLSVHLGLENLCQQRVPSLNVDNMDKQEGLVATGGHCFPLSGKPELQTLEGTLERKQKLQLGGKKAASRGWSSCHAVLHRHTLCFYQDRKDTLRSSACGLPLNLTGAECLPVPEYTKKPNCFQLRLRDGSEYLLSTPSRFMMKKWMMKIQASTGRDESFLSCADPDVSTSIKPFFCSSCGGFAQCRCPSHHDVTATFPRRKPPAAAQPKEIVVLTREFTHLAHGHLRSVEERSTAPPSDQGCCGADEERWKQTVTHRTSEASGGHDWLSNKRRSHSFTSATFQKIKPVTSHAPALASLEKGSNYCVTLVVGDKSSDGQAPSGGPEAPSGSSDPPPLTPAGWQQDEARRDSAPRSYASLPRPCNKSVFKKFFGKRDF